MQDPQGHCCIASLGFGSVATLFDAVIVACNGRGHCGSRSKMCILLRGQDMTEDTTEDDRQMLVSDLEILAGQSHKDTAALLV